MSVSKHGYELRLELANDESLVVPLCDTDELQTQGWKDDRGIRIIICFGDAASVSIEEAKALELADDIKKIITNLMML